MGSQVTRPGYLNEVTVEIAYDWAKLTKTQAYGLNQTAAAN